MKHVAAALSLLGITLSLSAAPTGNSADGILRGPFFSGTIMSSDGRQLAAGKGIVVTVGPNKDHYLCYDTDTLRCALGWSGDFLEFGKTQERIEWPPPPKIKGRLAFETRIGPGWTTTEDFTDPRANQQGPLPRAQAKYRGLYMHGDNVVLSHSAGDAGVLELPGLETIGGKSVFTRTLNLGAGKQTLRFLGGAGIVAGADEGAVKTESAKEFKLAIFGNGTNRLVIGVTGNTDMSKLSAQKRNQSVTNGTTVSLACELALTAPPRTQPLHLKVFIARVDTDAEVDALRAALKSAKAPSDLTPLTKGGPAQWPAVVTKGVLGTGNVVSVPTGKASVPPGSKEAGAKWNDALNKTVTNAGPYVVDHITEPTPNPWNAKTYFGGHDFFPDGRAAVCTFHGDVWLVSGLDATLEKVTWKRFASGLFQPLGTKIVDGKVHITGRDQITRLHDLNGDGEADFYENFNNDTFVTANYHEFCLGLDTDKAGNFYFAKGAPWPPTVQSPHQGTMLKVSKDGSKLDVIATGLRAPNGMGIGPNGWITVSDNQGHYMPSSKLNLIRDGGFYGMRQAAHGKAPPDDNIHAYDQPMCWLPMNMDNSSGGQVWVESTKWGPLNGQLLFMSYGKGTLFAVMPQEVDGVVQAGMVQFPLKFPSGTMRGRFSPKDGQLYTTGLRGWQTAGVRDGGFSRVRYTGAPVRMPQALHVSKDGVRITFTAPLDEASAKDTGNWNVEMWNYIYSGGYGSPEVSTKDPKVKQHDKPEVTSVALSADKKTVTLKLSELTPAMQMKIKFNLKAADGSPVSSEIYNTIHKVAAK
ncbi:MAG: heme-binding protein [Limisphaerales bacterium]|nr:MAG: heme-binding protein [Limisphaerales bacterium]KAG0508003.1 MAG: heme-binding protein [Limisphaerales bacterium]TXT50462.1 MAG: heme-binding protein [Limisphaerales bacterium]